MSLLLALLNKTEEANALTTSTEKSPSMDTGNTQHGLDADDECNNGSCYTPYSERPETYVVPVIFALIFTVGVVGNGTLVVIFMRHRALRNIPNTYIFSLALADLLVIICCVPLASLIYTLESWPWGGFLCCVSEFAKDLSIGVSVFTLAALSVERYCAIVQPLRKLQTNPLTFMTAITIWVVASALALPDLIRSDVTPILLNNVTNHSIVMCSPFGPPNDPYTLTYTKWNVTIKAIVYYFLPLTLIGVLYLLMARRLQLSAREMPGELAGPQSKAQARARRHVARMVVTFVIVFIVCFLPHHVFMLWFHLNPNSHEDYDDFWHILRIIGFCMSFLNSCVNPVALYCVSGVFRQYFHHYLCCKKLVISTRMGISSAAGNGENTTTFQSTIRRTNTYCHGRQQRVGSQYRQYDANAAGGGGGIVAGVSVNIHRSDDDGDKNDIGIISSTPACNDRESTVLQAASVVLNNDQPR